MASRNVTVRFSVRDEFTPKVRRMYLAMCVKEIIRVYDCPGCRAPAGERCRAASGPTRIHILRINAAKHGAVRGEPGCTVECPTGCGDKLTLTKNQISHVKSGLFECAP